MGLSENEPQGRKSERKGPDKSDVGIKERFRTLISTVRRQSLNSGGGVGPEGESYVGFRECIGRSRTC